MFSPEYSVYRTDRLIQVGGGVLIAIHNSIPSSLIDLSAGDMEFVCTCLFMNDFKIFITCSYIPPNSDIGVYMQHLQLLQNIVGQATSNDSILVLGDFNVPSVLWTVCPDTGGLVASSLGNYETFFHSLSEMCLNQFNTIVNMNGRLLDLVFCNVSDFTFGRTDPFVLPEDSHHPTLYITFNYDTPASFYDNDKQTRCLDFKRTNFRSLHYLLSGIVWPSFTVKPVNAFDKFYSLINDCLTESVPYMFTNSVLKGPPWFSKKLRYLRNRRNRLYKGYMSHNNPSNRAKYLVAVEQYNALNSVSYHNYLMRMRRKINSNPKTFFEFVNFKRKVNGFPSYFKLGDVVSSDDNEISNLFAEFFQSTYSNKYPVASDYPYHIQEYNIISNIALTYEEVLEGLKALQSNFSPGPDGIPAFILKKCADFLYIPLTDMFNSSLSSGYFPVLWKESFIVPLYKNGSRFDIANYRGIAKLSAIPKLFEKLVTSRLVHKFSGIVTSHQHGFVKGRSTVSNLLEFTSLALEAFTLRLQTDVIYTDFSKAFDTVSHGLLIHKLNLMGFPPGLLRWISSYLSGRTQRVKFKSSLSRVINVSSGVPQGSHLGPILFVLYLNDLPSIIRSSLILMYADDVKLFSSFNSLQDAKNLQEDLNSLVDWCTTNNMTLNLKKCKKMSFSRVSLLQTQYYIYDCELDNVTSFNDLGVLLDCKLRFHLQIDSCVGRAKSLLGFIKRWSKEFDDPYLTKRLFTSLVRPVLEYAVVVWCPSYKCDIDRIESVQKQFLIFALRGLGWNGLFELPPYENRLKLIDLHTLERRRHMLCVVFMSKLINGDIDSIYLLNRIKFNVPLRNSRHFIPIKLPTFKNNYELYNPFNNLCRVYNKNSNIIISNQSIYQIKRAILKDTT